jgi:hypothetical protein
MVEVYPETPWAVGNTLSINGLHGLDTQGGIG